MSITDQVHAGTGDEGWAIHTDGSLWYRGRIVVPQLAKLREEILREFHCSRFAVHSGGPQLAKLREEILWEFLCSHFAVHPGGTKKYHDLRRQYY